MIYRYTGFLTVSQCAQSIDYSTQAIRKAIKENRLNAYVIGKQYMIKVEDWNKFNQKRKGRFHG